MYNILINLAATAFTAAAVNPLESRVDEASLVDICFSAPQYLIKYEYRSICESIDIINQA